MRRANAKRLIVLAALGLLFANTALSQNTELQEKLAAAKQAPAENKQRLLQYQWIETTQLTLKENQKPPTDYMQDVKGVLALYVPPDPQKMEHAYEAGNMSLNPAPGVINLVFTNYAQPGDKMILTFDTAAKKITALNVDTYMGEAKDQVTLQVQMGSLPDGTNYPRQTILNASAKQLTVTTTNSDYQKL